MKVHGMGHPLVGTRAWHETSAARVAAGRDRPATYRPMHAAATAAPTRTAARPPARPPRRLRQAALLGVVSSVALLGCAALPDTPWRLEPSYHIAHGGGNAAQGYLALARQYEGEQRTAQALDAYRRAAAAAPDDADVQNTLGLALAQQSRFTEAVTALRRAVALAPARAPLLNNLGYALLLDGRAEEARAMFRLTLAVDPAHEMAGRNLAHVDQVLGATLAAAPVQQAAPAAPQAAPSAATPAVVMAAGTATNEMKPVAVAAEPTVAAVRADSTALLAAQVPLQGVRVEIVNGLGVRGAAARVGRWLRERGVAAGRLANLLPYSSPHTQVLYQPGMSAAAEEIARRMPIVSQVAQARAGTSRADVSILLGHDMRSHPTACATLGACPDARTVATATGKLPAGTAVPR